MMCAMPQKRKAYLIAVSEKERSILHNRVRFITSVLCGELVVNNKRRQTLIEELFAKASSSTGTIALSLFSIFSHSQRSSRYHAAKVSSIQDCFSCSIVLAPSSRFNSRAWSQALSGLF